MNDRPTQPEGRRVVSIAPFGTLADLSLCQGDASDPVRHGELFTIELKSKSRKDKSNQGLDSISLSRPKS